MAIDTYFLADYDGQPYGIARNNACVGTRVVILGAAVFFPSRSMFTVANVVQPPDDRSPMAIALEWSATIMTISAEMVVPGLLGYWLDQRLGTRVLFLLVGFGFGGTLAALGLMRIAKKRTGANGGRDHEGQSKHDRLE
ncbi:MAG: AtpZ/AtpI family protein [Planctomycetia bacterium]|nr:AtpZ/AtpI family protein [Planctomycetia bacterium]